MNQIDTIMTLADEYGESRESVALQLGANAGYDDQDPLWLSMNQARQALRAAIEQALAPGEPVAIVVDAYDTPGLQWLCQHPPERGDRLYTAPQQPKQEPVCPRPCNGRPDNYSMAECILAGECGCTSAGHKYAQRARRVTYVCPVCAASLERQE